MQIKRTTFWYQKMRKQPMILFQRGCALVYFVRRILRTGHVSRAYLFLQRIWFHRYFSCTYFPRHSMLCSIMKFSGLRVNALSLFRLFILVTQRYSSTWHIEFHFLFNHFSYYRNSRLYILAQAASLQTLPKEYDLGRDFSTWQVL